MNSLQFFHDGLDFSIGFYVVGSIISIILWVIALLRVKKIFSGVGTMLFIGKMLMIVCLITVDAIILIAFLGELSREQFRLSMAFLTGVQIIAAITVATSKWERRWTSRDETTIEKEDREVGDERRSRQRSNKDKQDGRSTKE